MRLSFGVLGHSRTCYGTMVSFWLNPFCPQSLPLACLCSLHASCVFPLILTKTHTVSSGYFSFTKWCVVLVCVVLQQHFTHTHCASISVLLMCPLHVQTPSFLCGSMAQHQQPPDVIPGTILGPQDKTHYLGAIILQTQMWHMEECTCQGTGKTQSMEQEEPVHPQLHTHCVHHDSAHCGPCALSSTSANTCTVPVGEEHHTVLVGWS